MSDGLLPCPFCGGHASLVSPAMGRPYVCCDDNFCTGPKPSADQAIAAWNRRALPATDAREAVKAVLIGLRDGQCCPKGRAYGETYDTMMEVERNPTGAFMAIEAMDAAMEKAKNDLRAILRALEEEGRDG